MSKKHKKTEGIERLVMQSKMREMSMKGGKRNALEHSLMRNCNHQPELETETNLDNLEGENFDKAFVNLVKKVDYIEDEVTIMQDAIIEMKYFMDKIAKNQKYIKNNVTLLEEANDKLWEKTEANIEYIDIIRKTIRNILRSVFMDLEIKSSNILVASEKMLKKRQKMIRKSNKLLGDNRKENDECIIF